MGLAFATLNEKVEIAALPEAVRADFKPWLNKNRNRFADYDAALLGFKGERPDLFHAVAPKPAAPTPAARRPALVKDVEAHVRAVPATEAAARVMSSEQFDSQIADLHAAGDHDGARALMRQYGSGEIVVKD